MTRLDVDIAFPPSAPSPLSPLLRLSLLQQLGQSLTSEAELPRKLEWCSRLVAALDPAERSVAPFAAQVLHALLPPLQALPPALSRHAAVLEHRVRLLLTPLH